MERNEEFHDPDYPEASTSVKKEPESATEADKIRKIRLIIRREFSKELEVRQNEVGLIDQRMISARRLLHRLRITLVSRYYLDQKLQLSAAQVQDEVAAQIEPRAKEQVSSLLRDNQRRLPMPVRKLLGRQTVAIEEIFKHRAPRNKVRKNYYAMAQAKNYTIPADTTKSLRPDVDILSRSQESGDADRPRKVPRQINPKITSVITLDEATRNKMKQRYRIIIGNTSKYAPPASNADRSTHKWLLYVRAAPRDPQPTPQDHPAAGDLSDIVTAVTVHLHHSYAPHHTVHLSKPPYQVSRRGWGEFPAKVELHFALPDRNRPATIEHTIKLDRHYTGLQTLGAETIVDVWLFSNEEMLKHEYVENTADQVIKSEPETMPDKPQEPTDHLASSWHTPEGQGPDSWLDFFTTDNTELDVDEMIIKPVKKEPEITPQTNGDIHQLKKEAVDLDSAAEEAVDFDVDSLIVKSKPEKDCPTERMIVDEAENLPTQLLNQAKSPRKRIMKYMDPTTGKIYYLEMDRNIDLSKVHEFVINSKGSTKTGKISPIRSNGLKSFRKSSKKGMSLLKPEVKSLLKTEQLPKKTKTVVNYPHIQNDHCYLGETWAKSVSFSENTVESVKTDASNVAVGAALTPEVGLYERLCLAAARLTCIRSAVNYLISKTPLVTEKARDPEYVRHFPFVVESDAMYWKLDFAKRRNIEWSRAKLINRILTEHFTSEPIWRTKQILLFSRLHGYYPVRSEFLETYQNTEDWSSWNDLETRRKVESNIKEVFPNASSIDTLTVFHEKDDSLTDAVDLTENSDEEIDVTSCHSRVKVKEAAADACADLQSLTVESEDDRLRFLFVERNCADIGIELRNEDVGNGYSYSAVHAVMLSAVKSFASELIRAALAHRRQADAPTGHLMPVWSSTDDSVLPLIQLQHAWYAAQDGRCDVSSRRGLGVVPPDHEAL